MNTQRLVRNRRSASPVAIGSPRPFAPREVNAGLPGARALWFARADPALISPCLRVSVVNCLSHSQVDMQPMPPPDQPTSPALQQDRPVLSYATPAADGLPEWHPEAEALIDQRAPLRKLRKYFRRGEDVAHYFAKSMERRYAPQNAGQICIGCGQPATQWWVVCFWTASGPLKRTEFAFGEPEVSFRTCHAICETCRARWLDHPWLNWVGWVMAWTQRAALAGLILCWIANVITGWRFGQWSVWLALFLFGQLPVVQVLNFLWRRHMPATIKRLVPRRRVRLAGAHCGPQDPATSPPSAR